jgi:hypothetical protein
MITAKWSWVPVTEGRQISHMSISGTISLHMGNGQNWEWWRGVI